MAERPEQEEYVSLKEAARLLRVTPGCLYKKFREGEGRELRPVKVYRKWLVPVAAIREVFERGAVPPAPPTVVPFPLKTGAAR